MSKFGKYIGNELNYVKRYLDTEDPKNNMDTSMYFFVFESVL